MTKQDPKNKKGFTLVEALIAFAIIAIVSTIVLRSFSSFRETSQLTEAHSAIIGLLKDARSRTLASRGSTNYGVHFETTRTVLFVGSVYDSSNPANELYVLPQNLKIGAINLTGGADDVVFTRLLGTTTASGTVTLSSQRSGGPAKTITILSTGGAQ